MSVSKGFVERNDGSMRDVFVHETAMVYGRCSFGLGCRILEHVILGYPPRGLLEKHLRGELEGEEYMGVVLGDNALLRPHTTVYDDVRIGCDFQCGHNVLIREGTRISDHVLLGTNTVVDGGCTLGAHVSVQSNVYLPTNTVVGDYVFIGPCAVLTNDRYPIRIREPLSGPVLERGVSVGANSTILPGVRVGEGSVVAAGAVVTRDVPAWSLAVGVPAVVRELPEELKALNKI